MERSAAGSSSDTASSRVSHVNGPYNVSRSRATVPPQRHYSSSSENDNVQGPLLPTRAPPASKSRSRWWDASKRRDSWYGKLRRSVRKILKHPYFPRKPGSIFFALAAFTTFAVSLTMFLIWYLNPDKIALPWRAYCSVPSPYSSPHYPYWPSSRAPPPVYSPPFPPANLESLSPAGVFLGVFTTDDSFERRMLVRTTWAGHPRSRNGAGQGDGGKGTSRTIVRFIMGKPRRDYEHMINMEMEKYNDIVILASRENMNSGKTHAFFTWASTNAWVPPAYFTSEITPHKFTYSDASSIPPPLAVHDPALARADASGNVSAKPWVRPDFVLKADDDSFVMLAELETRLRVELHSTEKNATDYWDNPPIEYLINDSTSSVRLGNYTSTVVPRTTRTSILPRYTPPPSDPLIYWGYLIKNRFMGGEIYGLSWSLVTWVAQNEKVKTITHGAEDKVTAKWMNLHPRREEVRWKSERCWIYNHPRSNTVYSHGFLFPLEATRVRAALMSYVGTQPHDILSSPWLSVIGANAPTPEAWAQSSVSTFGTRYVPPLPDLSPPQVVEALVEGSEMSLLREGSPMTREYAWTHREGRAKRYNGRRVGGTVTVHFIKEHAWFLETALALLEGEEITEAEAREMLEEED